ncbi:type II secretion system protein [[Clostridium] symbiosum]|uniref:type II secretion system protein n=1 Tax=Clostridium symbiosum TaxID=1512 RepID=UPI001D072053|nr:prepilin-type N-terminal cleavage/methylation domain-containing protein [[Clostridium] symbiosum]MCB6610338.1 prepilin-type N-terminal cleavage/methylation domain-containing protein [[Clostridium] symbiosum]MCB6931998.1 prepilin-type N-terminal cleavage/methylation domain-containing protein [[Clostridium] symbiosum]
MKKRNGGFTLIELLIALAVLSIMAGVLLQSFVISRRMNTKARKDELVLDAAKRTMEELKGYPFENLETFLAGGGGTPGEDDGSGNSAGGNVVIGNTIYRVERLEDGSGSDDGTPAGEEGGDGNPSSSGSRQGYRLTAEYGRDASGSGKAAYLICAEADYEKYNSTEGEDQEKSYSINRYQMPNIADVSSFQNVVIEPQALMKDDKSLTSQLLLKVNPDEEEDEEDGGEGAAEDSDGSGSEDETVYTEEDVKRYLWLSVKETAAADGGSGEAGTLTVQAQAVYTVKETEGNSYSAEESVGASFASVKKNVVKDKKTGLPANRVYLFLPDNETKYTWTSEEAKDGGEAEESGFPGFDRIYIGSSLEEEMELFIVAANPDQYEAEEANQDEKVKIESAEGTELLIYSNIGGKEPVSWKEAENRLYHLTVTVYEADYSGTGAENGDPERGREVLKLDSTKSE